MYKHDRKEKGKPVCFKKSGMKKLVCVSEESNNQAIVNEAKKEEHLNSLRINEHDRFLDRIKISYKDLKGDNKREWHRLYMESKRNGLLVNKPKQRDNRIKKNKVLRDYHNKQLSGDDQEIARMDYNEYLKGSRNKTDMKKSINMSRVNVSNNYARLTKKDKDFIKINPKLLKIK